MDSSHGFNTRNALLFTISLLAPIGLARAELYPDAWITLKATSALQVAAGVEASGITVDTSHGRVTLRGTIHSEGERARATEQVRHVAGVFQVRNLLHVVAPRKTAKMQRSDEAVGMDVQRTLRADRSLDDSNITVTSVSDGIVHLGGIAASSGDTARAIRSAGTRPGVRRVFSEIEAPGLIAARADGARIGNHGQALPSVRHDPVDARDAVIRRGVEKALNDLDPVENAGIQVFVKDGVVRLTGIVPTWQGNADRIDVARSVPGVRSIINRMSPATRRLNTW